MSVASGRRRSCSSLSPSLRSGTRWFAALEPMGPWDRGRAKVGSTRSMNEPRVPPDQAVEAFRQDAKAEYYAILDVITGFDQRIMIVKGWSVTLSLAALGLGFQQGHYALFALAGATALAFWFVDTLLKWHQMRLLLPHA